MNIENTPNNWNKGQTIANFLWWLVQNNKHDFGDVSQRISLCYSLEDEQFDALFTEFLEVQKGIDDRISTINVSASEPVPLRHYRPRTCPVPGDWAYSAFQMVDELPVITTSGTGNSRGSTSNGIPPAVGGL